ncbi:zinc finger protein-domain-containing protein [Cercophora newfieldiana]|uniref:Zinc finger protein-domain-containing protein n=1 Tax=Cercophora newfieldiana TaxID=92897 RepID=A0AA40CX43_9PEZI|nr:zinc finger protein-domain-containing protein [Cercophora newfieldiana]
MASSNCADSPSRVTPTAYIPPPNTSQDLADLDLHPSSVLPEATQDVKDPLSLELGRLLSFQTGTHTTSPRRETSPTDASSRGIYAYLRISDAYPETTNASNSEHPPFRKIGAGACGIVLARPGPYQPAVKLSKAPNLTELHDDYVAHTAIAKASRDRYIGVNLPKCHLYIPDSEEWFPEQNPDLFEVAKPICNLPTHTLITERIPALPAAVRERLIEKYCAPKGVDGAKSDPANEDCLVRVYLGSMNGRSETQFFSLRNFKLHLNQMIELGLDVGDISRRIGATLANIHWGARQDGRDIEFVLGGARISRPSTVLQEEGSGAESRGPPELWVLDFNQVRPITLDDKGVAQAVDALRINDPYYPKPLRESAAERDVWEAFVTAYLHASQAILRGQGDGIQALPRMFIHGIIELERAKKATA